MKRRLLTLVLAMALCLGSVVSAKADGGDIKVRGTYEFAFGWIWNDGFSNSVNKSGDTPKDAFIAQQRIRVQVNFIINEYLQGVYGLESNQIWGRTGTAPGGSPYGVGGTTGGQADADGINIQTRWAYLDWLIPNTPVQVRMGLQPVALPSTRLGSVVLSTDIAGIVVSSPTPLDWLSVTAFWLRPYDAYAGDRYTGVNAGRDRFDETDAFGFILPLSFRNIGLEVKPWFVFANVGASSGLYERSFGGGAAPGPGTGSFVAPQPGRDDRTHGIWAGINFDFKLLDPLTFGLDVVYGNLHKNNLRTDWAPGVADNIVGSRGWFIAAALDYKLTFGSSFSVTPGIFGWWASGDSAGGVENGQYGRLPVIGVNGGNFHPTSFGTQGVFNSTSQYINNGEVNSTGTGTWGVGIQLAKATFIKDLDHTLRFAYYRGTNDADIVRSRADGGLGRRNNLRKYTDDGLYLTDKDSVFEVNFDHTYKIYENLTAALELGWLHLNSDEEVWGDSSQANPGNTGSGKASTSAWKAQLLFTFSF
jgi:hypothetical protein